MNTCSKIAETQIKGKPTPSFSFFSLLFEPLSSCLFLPATSNSLGSGHLSMWYSYDGHCLSFPVASKTLTPLPQPCRPLAGFSPQLSLRLQDFLMLHLVSDAHPSHLSLPAHPSDSAPATWEVILTPPSC